ncbi:MAG: glycosyltransferase [bacterium]|nr:glycosyltransferase [bacterium]
MRGGKIAVIIPTYNEKDNIVPLVNSILALPMDISVFIVDDNSPDGTGETARKYFRGNDRVNVYIRTENRGRGCAGIFGYGKALEGKFDIIGEMDGDFSHTPEFIIVLVSLLKEADVVSGSRFLRGGRSLRQSIVREFVTYCARIYLRLTLGIKLTDPTSGFRFFKSSVLSEIYPKLKSKDAFIVTEVFYHIFRQNFKVKEAPIIFCERKYGKSKLKFFTLVKYLYRVVLLRVGLFNG